MANTVLWLQGHIFSPELHCARFLFEIFSQKQHSALCCILSGGAERTRILRKAGRRWRKNSDQSIDGWLQLFCFFLEENHAWRRQQFIALVGQSNGKLESFVCLQLCKYWCLSSTSPWHGSTFGGVCPVSHSCCRRYLRLIFWNYTSLITPPALYSFPALS